jgi:ClpP class serine protease
MARTHSLTPDQVAMLDQRFSSAREVLAELVAWARGALDEEPDVSVTSARVYVALQKQSIEVRTGIAAVALVELARLQSSEAVG